MRARLIAPLVLAAAWLAQAAQAAPAPTSRCEPAPAGRERCVAALPDEQVRSMALAQGASQWCWAAAVSMVLRGWGVQVPQAQVVRQHWGVAVDLGVPPQAMAPLLNRIWRDGAGRSVSLSAESLARGVSTLDAQAAMVATALHAGQPLVVAVPGHAMVLVRLDYEREPGGRVVGGEGVVLDPASGARRVLRGATPVVTLLRVSGGAADGD